MVLYYKYKKFVAIRKALSEGMIVMLKKIKKRIFNFMFICFMILYVPCYVLAQENDSNNIGLSEDVMVACDKALETIAVMKQGTEIYIGDIFNVINEEGEMEGYSLGFFQMVCRMDMLFIQLKRNV